MKKRIPFFMLFFVWHHTQGMDIHTTEASDSYRKNVSLLLSIPQLTFTPVLDYLIVPDYQEINKHYTITLDELNTVMQDISAINPFHADANATAVPSEADFKEKIAPNLHIFPVLKHYYVTDSQSTIPKAIDRALFWLQYRQKPEHLLFLAAVYALNYFETNDYQSDIHNHNDPITRAHYEKRSNLKKALISKNKYAIDYAKAACRTTKSFYEPNLQEATLALISEDMDDLERLLDSSTLNLPTLNLIDSEIEKVNTYIKSIKATHNDSYFSKCALS